VIDDAMDVPGESGVLDALRSSGALKDGHFLLSSGRHSDRYVEKFDLLRDPAATSAACATIVERFRDREIDVVVGPTTGGIILAFEIARQLGAAAAYAERAEGSGTAREFRRGTTFAAGSRVLVVDDILTTGGSVQETLDALQPNPVDVIAVVVLVDRASGRINLGVRLDSLVKMEIASWEPAACPLCAQGAPLTKPGTTPVVATR
jgi:orotate phosphoribosyltransferase